MMSICGVCNSRDIELLLDFGEQPVCSHFLGQPDQETLTFALALSQCRSCGLIQNIRPAPVEILKPFYNWITYREPEDHLDDLVDHICRLEGLDTDSFICGLTQYDAPLIERLQHKRFKHARLFDPVREYGIQGSAWGVETIQERITSRFLVELNFNKQKPDLILAGFILEHVHDLHGFIMACKELLSAKGYLVIQVPDVESSFKELDYSVIWEEHVFYFTGTTLSFCPGLGEFKTVFSKKYSHGNGGVLSSIWRISDDPVEAPWVVRDLNRQFETAQKFKEGFEQKRAVLKNNLSVFKKEKGKIALFGAGHQACIFVNLFDLSSVIEFIVDDDKKKNRLFMPGTGLEIKPSASLVSEDISLCLMAVSKPAERAIQNKNTDFIKKGGSFMSIHDLSLYTVMNNNFMEKGFSH